MRVAVWWSVAVLSVLAFTSAQRTQASGVRTGRRLSSPDQDAKLEDTEQNGEIQTSFRPRSSRRRNETLPKEITRSRTRSRPVAAALETTPQTPERNERVHSRRTYTRPERPVETDTTKEPKPSRASVIRSRSRQNYRQIPSTTPTTVENSSPMILRSEAKVDSNEDEILKTTPKQEISSTQFRRRSSISTEPISLIKPRGRINVRPTPTARASDLSVSGTTNSLHFTNKDQLTFRNSEDLRNSRKLRYRTRFAETDTNLAGEGITATVDVTKSSQIKETTSQPETTFAPIVVESMQTSSEEVPVKVTTTTERILNGSRRPLTTRGRVGFKPQSQPKVIKKSDEISEDDNYPEPFKALLQKNAATQPSSPSSESLSVKASEKSYKTYSSSALPPDTITTKTKFARFRSKNTGGEEHKNKEVTKENQLKNDEEVQKKPEKVEHKSRGFTPRNKKTYSTTTAASSISSSTQRATYKFQRKLKITTESPNTESTSKQKVDTNSILKKTLSRPSYFSRKQGLKNLTETTNHTLDNNEKNISNKHILRKPALPKTSFYTRLRNNKTVSEKTPSSTVEAVTEKNNEIIQTPAEKKIEDAMDMPLIFSLLKSPNNNNTIKVDIQDNKDSQEMFIIAVSSKESKGKSIDNEVTNKNESSKKEENVNNIEINGKYHANYKGKSAENEIESKETVKTSRPFANPSIRNIHIRTNGAQKSKVKEQNKETLSNIPKSRNSRKYGDSYSKTTESTTNSITSEPETHKARFSSKYKASLNDKPYYKPTVPTVTPSTAWLKFFVTDHQLAKSVEEPKWFDEDLINDVTTEMSRTFTPPSTNHESSIELVEKINEYEHEHEYQEYHLGPDMNAISFTLPRSKLSSADLRLSESLMKPFQISNIEASQHSASVTVSIFDALADILTSTPRTPRLSTTTEVKTKQINTNDKKQTLNGVSNSINVNIAKSLNDTFTSNSDVSVVTKSVQTTVQTTPNVNNQPVVDKETSSLNPQGVSTAPLNTQPTPTSFLTTPISARKPFAIKVLYSDTEPQTDPITTATQSTPFQPSTDNPSTVLNKKSDILLTNNHLVSSQLTSMLTYNINDLLKNMDEDSRNKLSIDMAKLLRNLIPRALDGLKTINDDVEVGDNTTPYSLEDIKDTENVKISDNIDTGLTISSDETLQTVETQTNVNSTLAASLADSNTTQEVNVNIISPSTESSSSILSISRNQTTESQITSTTPSTPTTLRVTSTSIETASSSGSLNDNRLSEIINTSIPLPFFTNAQIKDFTPTVADIDETLTVASTTQTVPLPTQSLRIQDNNEANTQDLSRVSSAQLWVLSKKARVLQMIEDLIRQHQDEIATTSPLTEMINQENNIPLSNRLTQILNTMTSTTETNDLNQDISTTPTAPSNPVTSFVPISSLPSLTTDSTISTATAPIFELTPRLATPNVDKENKTSTETSIQSTTLSSIEVTSTQLTQIDMETTTSSETADLNIDTTTMPSVDKTTQTNVNNTNISNTVSSNAPGTSTSTIPKRDYVIFGILPNNTVVRKDPNDDILETITESSPYIIYSVLPNNTVIRRFPNGTRVPRFMQKIDVLPISPWSLKNPYSPIHNNPAIVRPRSNLIRVSTNTETPTDINNGTEAKLTNDNVNNQQTMIPTSALNINDSSSFGVTTNRLPAEKSTASHVLSLRTTTMLPSVDEILLNSISSAAREEMVISSMTSSTREPRILTLDIDPETKQIRTEKPGDGNGNAKFKFIPIDEVITAPRESNVLKLASKSPPVNTDATRTMIPTTETNTQSDTSTTVRVSVGTPVETSSVVIGIPDNTESTISLLTATTPPSTTMAITTLAPTTTESTTEITTSSSTSQSTTTDSIPTTTQMTVIPLSTTPKVDNDNGNVKLLQNLLQGTERSPKSLNIFSNSNQVSFDSTTAAATKKSTTTTEISEEAKILQLILAANQKQTIKTSVKTTTIRSIEDDIKQFEEDTKLLKALLAATGQNPSNLNIPTLDNLNLPTSTTTMQTTTSQPRTTTKATTTQTVDDLTKLAEDAKLLQTLLQAGQNSASTDLNLPIISEVKPNVRIASPMTTTIGTTSTTQNIQRPVYRTTTMLPIVTTVPSTTPILTTLQTRATTESRASTTNFPRRRQPTTTARSVQATMTSRRPPASGFTMTTEVPSTSTFSDVEDILFLQNLKSVLKTSPNPDDPEAALANRIIALAVERSLNEISSGQEGNIGRTGKTIAFTTTTTTSSTTTTTTTTPRPTTVKDNNTPSLADDIKQFEEDTKLLQALIKATGQDPSQFKIPTLPPNINTKKVSVQEANRDAKLIDFPSPANNLDQMSPKPTFQRPVTKANIPTSLRPFGAKIAVKDEQKNVQDDGNLLKTLITLQGVQETTTLRTKLAITGQSPDEALNKLINRAKPTNTMMSDSTKSPITISTEYGKSNDALLAALLKDQGFGPTTASSLDEQLRLAALLNQVVVTPKTRTTTPPPPPPARRPVLDGLAWLWQQWRETGPGPEGARPSRRPSPSQSPATSNRVNWFGSGPFVGNAEDQSGNRVPLEPPRAVPSEGPGRGQLVSAAINVTRAFSQFLGAALQGAAQTFQNVFQAGQRAATDVYRSGSASG